VKHGHFRTCCTRMCSVFTHATSCTTSRRHARNRPHNHIDQLTVHRHIRIAKRQCSLATARGTMDGTLRHHTHPLACRHAVRRSATTGFPRHLSTRGHHLLVLLLLSSARPSSRPSSGPTSAERDVRAQMRIRMRHLACVRSAACRLVRVAHRRRAARRRRSTWRWAAGGYAAALEPPSPG